MSAATAKPEFIVKPNANPMPEAERLEAFRAWALVRCSATIWR